MTVTVLGCVTESTGPNGGMNHVELKISQNQIDVYATDAGTTTPLKHIAVISNADLKFSRGYVQIEDTHFNADKGDDAKPSQRIHTYAWDNIAFDGPVLARDLSFDVNDSLVAYNTSNFVNGVFLGWETTPTQPAILNSLPITNSNIAAATSAYVTFNFFTWATSPSKLMVALNAVDVPPVTSPYPDSAAPYAFRAIKIPVPLNQLKPGANVISIKADQYIEIANVSLHLEGAGGIVNPH